MEFGALVFELGLALYVCNVQKDIFEEYPNRVTIIPKHINSRKTANLNFFYERNAFVLLTKKKVKTAQHHLLLRYVYIKHINLQKFYNKKVI